MFCRSNTRRAANRVVSCRTLIMRRAQTVSFEIATEPSRDRDHLRAEVTFALGPPSRGHGSRALRAETE